MAIGPKTSLEEMLCVLHASKLNLALLVGESVDDGFAFGVRITPWQQDSASHPQMLLADGQDVQGAVYNGIQAYRRRNWESLDWAKRPIGFKVRSKAGQAAALALE